MKFLTIVGGRPQFIKMAVVSRELRKRHEEILVHTGQHYDYNMSQQFFDEMNLPTPDYNLGISGGRHGEMTGKMLIALEDVMIKEKPDAVIIFGDMNSTLAGALAAAKLHIPIAHVESGGRTHSMTNPEELNRICADHLSTLLLACTKSAMEELEREGLKERSYLVGDPMYDAFLYFGNMRKKEDVRLKLIEGGEGKLPAEFYYLTCHREENTKRDEDLTEILKAMDSLDAPTIYPVHPRNNERVKRLDAPKKYPNIIFSEPVGYIDSLCLVKNAKKVVTDSGGLQREAFFAGKKCVVVLNFITFPEIMTAGRNTLSAPKADEILEKLSLPQDVDEKYLPFGNGNAAEKIVECIEKYLVR